MRERRPITSVKRADQKIGYIEGDQAFDLFARPCASYDHATGLLRDLNTQMIVGYVSLKGSFVGSSLVAEELFQAPLQNGGEPLDETFLSSERVFPQMTVLRRVSASFRVSTCRLSPRI